RLVPLTCEYAHVPSHEPFAAEEAGGTTNCKERAKRDGVFASGGPGTEQHEGNHAAEQHGQEDRQERDSPSQKRSEHGAELDVATAHPLSAGQEQAALQDGPKDPSPDDDSDRRIAPRDTKGRQIGKKANDDSGQRDRV